MTAFFMEPRIHTFEGPLLKSKILLSILFAVFLFLLASCANHAEMHSDPVAAPTAAPLKQIRNTRYRILPGDEIEIKLQFHPQYNERLTVLPDGWISLPIVNTIEAAGKSPDELALELETAYARELKNPEVIVLVREFGGRLSYVGGEVKAPQAVTLNFPVTLLQAVIQCGDILPTAREENVLVLRTLQGAAPQAIIVNLSAIRSGKAPDLHLEPYDIVYVPQTVIAKVGDFIEAYINRIIPKSINFLFTYELHSDSD